jgi:large subunit ribosomal protein L3
VLLRHHHVAPSSSSVAAALTSASSLQSLISNLVVSVNDKNNNNIDAASSTQCNHQRRTFATISATPPLSKIYKINSTKTDDEIQAIIDAELQKLADEKERKEYRNWKPGQRKRPLVISYRLEDFEEEEARISGIKTRWTLRDKRCGALGIKLGMMPLWDGWGERHPCTVLYLDNNVVLRNKTKESIDGYDAVELGAGERKVKNITKPLMGHYAKFGVADHPPYIVREFRVTTKDAMPPPGTVIHARHFIPGQNVDVSGITKGKGFQGGMKKHGFKGMPASHGTSRSHRAIGSTVSCLLCHYVDIWFFLLHILCGGGGVELLSLHSCFNITEIISFKKHHEMKIGHVSRPRTCLQGEENARSDGWDTCYQTKFTYSKD